jgi:orotate phosphoribosyltransferase
VEFYYTQPTNPPCDGAHYSVSYALPSGTDLSHRRIAVVDDVINAGSAARAKLAAQR